LGKDISTIKENKEALLDARNSQEVGLEPHKEKTKCMFVPWHCNAGQ